VGGFLAIKLNHILKTSFKCFKMFYDVKMHGLKKLKHLIEHLKIIVIMSFRNVLSC